MIWLGTLWKCLYCWICAQIIKAQRHCIHNGTYSYSLLLTQFLALLQKTTSGFFHTVPLEKGLASSRIHVSHLASVPRSLSLSIQHYLITPLTCHFSFSSSQYLEIFHWSQNTPLQLVWISLRQLTGQSLFYLSPHSTCLKHYSAFCIDF